MKKIMYLFLIIAVAGCNSKSENQPETPKVSSKAAETQKTIDPQSIVAESKEFPVGDIDNDHTDDTAYIDIQRDFETNQIICGEKNCDAYIKFNGNIPAIRFNPGIGVYITKTEDLNNDNANEIMIFSRTNEGMWSNIYVWSFKNRVWNEIARTKVFISEDRDFDNRIIKEDGNYYLIGHNQWEEDKNGGFKKVKVKIKTN